MNHPTHNPTAAMGRSGPGAADSARARLAAAFALPLGPVREQRITEAVLELVAAEIGDRHPAITTVLFDWEPYGGLGVAGFRDRHGNPVADHDLDLDIIRYATDIRATADTALTRPRPHEPGLFRLDLTTTTSHDCTTDTPMTTTPSVGDRVRITDPLPGDPDPFELGATGTVTHLSAPRLGTDARRLG
ncbi:hypothetical protein [Nocardia sienata]|uniref:hypothetical protein n=1 Tax=Nocardia sienata TaxID=248552 RepID=UPI0007A41658|nr:hypothetical protein [Nocardia sienata]